MSNTGQQAVLAVFDFDGTMIKGDSIVALIRYALQKGVLNLFQLPPMGIAALLVQRGKLSPAQGKSRALHFMGKMSGAQLDAFHLAFCREVLMPKLYTKALQRLAHHRAQGHLCLIVSASPDSYMRHMSSLLGVDAVIASKTDARGRISVNMRGETKAGHLHEWLRVQHVAADWPNSWAYGDSAWDLPVLRLTGNPVMVNPSIRMRREGAGLPVENWQE